MYIFTYHVSCNVYETLNRNDQNDVFILGIFFVKIDGDYRLFLPLSIVTINVGSTVAKESADST